MEENVPDQEIKNKTIEQTPIMTNKPEPVKHKYLKGKWLVFFLITSLLMITTSYFFFTNKPAVSPEKYTTNIKPTISVDPTANWKTYTNNKFHYSFKYPNQWIVREESVSNNQNILSSQFFITYSKYDEELNITVFNKNTGPGYSQYITPYTTPSQIKFAYVEGTVFETDFTGEAGRLFRQEFQFTKDNYGYNIVYNIYKEEKDYGKHIFNQILSTFKFLD